MAEQQEKISTSGLLYIDASFFEGGCIPDFVARWPIVILCGKWCGGMGRETPGMGKLFSFTDIPEYSSSHSPISSTTRIYLLFFMSSEQDHESVHGHSPIHSPTLSFIR